MHRLAALVAAALVLVALPPATARTATAGTVTAGTETVQLRLRAAIRQLPVAVEDGTGYDRDEFRHWVDADGDCQDTRDEVLAAESLVAVEGCDITTGSWLSYYDRETWTQSSDVDIDHLVPLKEAWDSGARTWDDDTRERYANDLDDPRSLVAVTDNVNQSKSDRDPAEWLPTYGVCKYVVQWAAVKTRWGLTVDRAEKTTLRRLARDCPNRRLTVRTATLTAAPS
jgi:hypothetical protein